MLDIIINDYKKYKQQGVIGDICDKKENYYLSYPIRKSSGKKRWIDAPQEPLKQIQEDILFNLMYKMRPHKAAVGFVANIGVEYGAEKHLGNNVLLNMDLQNFFPSIRLHHISKLVKFINMRAENIFGDKTQHFSNTEELIFRDIVTYRGSLPQGSPCSPAIANMVAYGLDKELQKFADKYNLTYTRYADDLSFSHPNEDFPLQEYIGVVEYIIRKEGFRANKKKTRVMRPHQRMSVTGVVINEKLSVPRWKWRNFRAKLHNLNKAGKPINKLEWQQLKGYCEWIKQLHPKRGERFLKSLGQIPRSD